MQQKLLLYITLLLIGCQTASGQVRLAANNKESGLNLKTAEILIDASDPISVSTAARLFANDIRLITGTLPLIKNKLPRSGTAVIAGTLSGNQWIRKLAAAGKIQTEVLKNQWERYGIFLLQDPFPGIDQALVIAGSDRRAVAYGLFSISEQLGVSPWYWWADLPVPKRKDLFVDVKNFLSPAPSVKYRGIFINDEDWGLLPWAKHTFDPQLKDIGPKTYAKVFELLLRLKANYLCPAMHEASGAFNKYLKNKLVADSFGIVMGSVHTEPLLFNNASEWDKKTMGEWNYMTNKEGILKVLDQRVKENSRFENVYTLALRGLHDKAMTGNYTLKQRVHLVNQALKDQRNILKKYIDSPIASIPQAFTPYKEVLELYRQGLDLPDDVILVWPDDNYGYMKQLSNSQEQKRAGGSGVYYHASYLGIPHDYLWISSNAPALMYEELNKAYKTGADRLWLLNAGDIKSCEFAVSLFLEMAYALPRFNYQNIADFQANWLSASFGEQYLEQFKKITRNYQHLSFIRKPEYMGWGSEWNSFKYPRERYTDTEFSFVNYREASNRWEAYSEIGSEVEKIYRELPEEQKAAFFQLLYYPVKGAELMNKKWLTAQRQRLHAFQRRNDANMLIDSVKHYYDTLYKISYQYNDLNNGKWKRMLSIRQGVTASYFELPKLDSITVANTPRLGVAVEGQPLLKGASGPMALPTFNRYLDRGYFIELFNLGMGTISWQLETSASWIRISKNKGQFGENEKITVSIDWDQVPANENASGWIRIKTKDKTEIISVTAYNPPLPKESELEGLYIEDNGVISIDAAGFHRKKENEAVKMQLINNLGYERQALMLGSPVAAVQNPRDNNAPGVSYDFYCFNRGLVDVYTYVLPTFPLSSDRDFGFHEQGTLQTRYAVSIDEGAVALPSSSAGEYTQDWQDHVLRNAAINKSTLYIDKPGKHSLHIKCGDPGIVLQKIVLDFGGMKKSYQGPPTTRVQKSTPK
ncbi:glycosyl hydrolase 115 family protein [Niabella terrae]